jgi:hypothetical protein
VPRRPLIDRTTAAVRQNRRDRFGDSWRPTCLETSVMSRTLGIILIVLGLVGLAWGGFTYTTRQKVLDVGPIHATRDKTHTVPLPPIAGAVALLGGIVLVLARPR